MAGRSGQSVRSARPLSRPHRIPCIHGTNQPDTIGHAVSSGCFRLDNADVIDLYNRIKVGAKVVVKQSNRVGLKRKTARESRRSEERAARP